MGFFDFFKKKPLRARGVKVLLRIKPKIKKKDEEVIRNKLMSIYRHCFNVCEPKFNNHEKNLTVISIFCPDANFLVEPRTYSFQSPAYISVYRSLLFNLRMLECYEFYKLGYSEITRRVFFQENIFPTDEELGVMPMPSDSDIEAMAMDYSINFSREKTI